MAKSVLIVDDSAVIRNSLCFLLETEGFDVQSASNGIEGLEKVEARHFDAIIADIQAGMSPVESIVDRSVAIRRAIAGAGVNDIVLLAGKGHEPYQEVAGVRAPFSDVDQARAALALRRECPRVVA